MRFQRCRSLETHSRLLSAAVMTCPACLNSIITRKSRPTMIPDTPLLRSNLARCRYPHLLGQASSFIGSLVCRRQLYLLFISKPVFHSSSLMFAPFSPASARDQKKGVARAVTPPSYPFGGNASVCRHSALELSSARIQPGRLAFSRKRRYQEARGSIRASHRSYHIV